MYIINNFLSFIKFHKTIISFLNEKKKKYKILIVFKFFMILEMTGIGLVFPILKIITDPSF